jgi:hypothetical protein
VNEAFDRLPARAADQFLSAAPAVRAALDGIEQKALKILGRDA